jgi:HlyD family secretion protein
VILRFGLMCLGLALISACGKSELNTLTIEVEQAPFVFSVTAKGEMIAAQELPLNAPRGNRGTLTLAWLEEENKPVKAGDVVARFDGTEHELTQERSQLELEKNEISKGITVRDLDLKQFAVQQDSGEVDEELKMVERFSIEDLAVYSKIEVIDQLLVKEYLAAQQYYFNWQGDSQQEQGAAQIQLLDLEGKGHRDAIQLSAAALENLEVRAPIDGVLIHAKNWRNEKVREGQSLWPGSKIAAIPKLDTLQARLYVFEISAAGIDVGQEVEVRLDAFPEILLKGQVHSIANIAAPIERNNPSKYFEVQVALENTDPSFMRPGQKLEGEIFIAKKDQTLSVPNQVIFKSDDESWVFKRIGSRFEKQVVTTGLRSLTKTEVLSGLEAGDDLALTDPGEEAR